MNEFTLQRFTNYRVLAIQEKEDTFAIYRDVETGNGTGGFGYMFATYCTQKEIVEILNKEYKNPSPNCLDTVEIALFKQWASN